MDEKLLDSEQAVNAWSVLFERALPLCSDMDEAILSANLAFESLSVLEQAGLSTNVLEHKPTQPIPSNNVLSIDAFFAHDIHNRKAQGILNKSLKAARGLSASARKDLEKALKHGAKDSGEAILKFIDKYRLQLAKLLTATQLASVLEGARDVAKNVPTLAVFHGAVAPPPSLEPKEAVALVEKLEKLTTMEQATALYELPYNQQSYVQQALAAKQAGGPVVPPSFTPPTPPSGSPEEIHFVTIDEAVKHLAEKNVMTRERFDALDTAAKNKSFTVANVDAEDTLTKIRDTLAENVKTGADYDKFRKEVLSAVDEGTFMSDAHMEVVFRTNVQSAFSDGQMTVLQHPLVRNGFPYSAYDAIHDSRVRHNHLALEKLGIQKTNIYRTDDPVFQTFRPPWDYNDRCGWTPMTVRQASEAGIEEAIKWLDTGVEPAQKAFVPMPNFAPPEGFRRAVSSAPLSIQLSLQPLTAFAGANEELEDSTTLAIENKNPKQVINEIIYRFAHFRSKYSDTVILKIKTGIKKTDKTTPNVVLPQGTMLIVSGQEKELDGTRTIIAEVSKWGGNAGMSVDDKITENIGAAMTNTANPQVKRRYGEKPGPGWTSTGLTSHGVQIWTWGPNTEQPQQEQEPQQPPQQQPTEQPQQQQEQPQTQQPEQAQPTQEQTQDQTQQQQTQPVQSVPVQEETRFTSAQAYQDVMTKLRAGQQLTTEDKLRLPAQLSEMSTPQLMTLYEALGGVSTDIQKEGAIQGIEQIISGQPQPTPQALPPTQEQSDIEQSQQRHNPDLDDLFADKVSHEQLEEEQKTDLIEEMLPKKTQPGRATVLSKAEMDAHIKQHGGKELWRGVPLKKYAEQFKSGDLRTGGGAYGKGIYTGYGHNGHSTASHIANSGDDPGHIARMALHPDAKVTKWDDAETAWKDHISKNPESPFARKNFKDSGEAVAAHAKASGHDALDIEHNGFMNVLNPEKLMVEHPDADFAGQQEQANKFHPEFAKTVSEVSHEQMTAASLPVEGFNIKPPPLVNTTHTVTHISSNLDSIRNGLQDRPLLGMSAARYAGEEMSSPTLNEHKGETGRATLEVGGNGLDYENPSHKEWIDALLEHDSKNIIPNLRKHGVDWVNGWNSIGADEELHIINPSKTRVLKIEKRPMSEMRTESNKARTDKALADSFIQEAEEFNEQLGNMNGDLADTIITTMEKAKSSMNATNFAKWASKLLGFPQKGSKEKIAKSVKSFVDRLATSAAQTGNI